MAKKPFVESRWWEDEEYWRRWPCERNILVDEDEMKGCRVNASIGFTVENVPLINESPLDSKSPKPNRCWDLSHFHYYSVPKAFVQISSPGFAPPVRPSVTS